MKVLFNKQRYEFFSKSQHSKSRYNKAPWCCSISKDTNFSANHNPRLLDGHVYAGVVQ